jgi:hypothetical protein
MIFNYNLPPWLTTTKKNPYVCLVNPRKGINNSGNIDVYLIPLMEELQELWRGVDA